jgi:hypothetical protein
MDVVPGFGFLSFYPAAVTMAMDADVATASSATASLAVTTTTAVPGSGFLSFYPAAATNPSRFILTLL